MNTAQARAIAFYLPQYYPTPENDAWWGKGFTEWTNVTRAKPLYPGHRQPNLPADLGYYDLRVPEVREQQAVLARAAGIEGFCYWHYWFGHGRKILGLPIAEMLQSGRPGFPFCLCWANGSWSGVWHGGTDHILIDQQYPGEADYAAFFYDTLPALKDPRYIRVEGKPLFLVYQPAGLPDLPVFLATWRKLAVKEGLPGLYLLALNEQTDLAATGMDGKAPNLPGGYWGKIPMQKGLWRKFERQWVYRSRHIRQQWLKQPKVFPYSHFVANQGHTPLDLHHHPTVMPNWDNTPRRKNKGLVLEGATPTLFGLALQKALGRIVHKPFENRLLFIKAWNEWAEGNYLEPDEAFGHGWLDACKKNLL